jgi:thymidine kinase
MDKEPAFEFRPKAGSIEVICGPMFSGKTEELLRRLRRARIANITMAIFKPVIDNRYSELNIVSHDDNFYPSLLVSTASDILNNKGDAQVIAFDEAQFFDESLPSVAGQLARDGIRVIASGLDMDFKGNPFGFMPQLMAIADHVTKLSAICVICGADATYSYRKSGHSNQIMIGAKDIYEPRCRQCYYGDKL